MQSHEGETLKFDAMFEHGKEAGTKAEDSPIFQRFKTRALEPRSYKATSILPIWQKIETTNAVEMGVNQDFRKGYIEGLQEFLAAHNVDIKWLPTYALSEALMLDDVLIGYLRGIGRESPNRGRDLNQKTKTKQFEKFLNLESKPQEWQQIEAADELRAERQQEGYKLGFLASVMRDFNVTLYGFEVPADSQSYEALIQGLRGETRQMPLDVKSQYQHGKESLRGIFADDALNDHAYRVGQRLWLAGEGLSLFYANFIRHPAGLMAFKAGLEGRIWPPQIEPTALFLTPKEEGKIEDNRFPKKENEIIYNENKVNKYKIRERFFDKLEVQDPFEVARSAERTGYEMGRLARQGRKKK